MSEYARPTNTSNPILNPLVYWRVSAFALTAVAILGIVLTSIGKPDLLATDGHSHLLPFTWTHNVLHVVLALAAFLFGFANLPGRVVKVAAIVFGLVYGALGVLGFFVADPLGSGLSLHLTESLSIVHVLLGVWALAAGFGARYD